MRPQLPFVIALLALLAVGVLGWTGWRKNHAARRELAFATQRMAYVEAENLRLQALLVEQQREKETETEQTGRTELEGIVTGLRGLKFLMPVVYRNVPRSELPSILRQKLSQQVPDQEFEHTGIALAALGLIPNGLDLKKTYLSLLGEQVGAFYDQHSRELYTFSGQSLKSSQNRVILAHELTHALEDQHFHLDRLPLETKGNDDRALAVSALVEGDATLVMNRYLLGNVTADVLRESLVSTVTTDVRQLAAAPRFLRESLLFPYLKGQEFCEVLYEQGGWAGLARAFERPPASTSQILHPERFLTEPREEPIAVDFANTEIFRMHPIDDNVLGEFGLKQFLSVCLKNDLLAAELASGWRGDRFVVYGDATAANYVWEIAWRLPGQAERFARTVSASSGSTTSSSAGTRPHFLAMSNSVQQRSLIISAQDAQWLAALKNRFANDFTLQAAEKSTRP